MKQHTAGPWNVSGILEITKGASFDHERVNADGPQNIAVVRIPWVNNAADPKGARGECAANARLIAAAPKLLEALQSIASHNGKHYGFRDEWTEAAAFGEIVNIAKAAIALVE